ncbi:MAG: STAS/SEC14 domain-containing protein [Janthinobacterium lividum]
MFTAIDYPNQNLLKLAIAGKLTKADYEGVVPILNAKVAQFGKVNVCLEIGGLDAMTLPAIWKEAKQDIKHFNDFNRAAVVSDNSLLLQAASAVVGSITPAQVKHFDAGQKAEALQWALGADPASLASQQVYQTPAAS